MTILTTIVAVLITPVSALLIGWWVVRDSHRIAAQGRAAHRADPAKPR